MRGPQNGESNRSGHPVTSERVRITGVIIGLLAAILVISYSLYPVRISSLFGGVSIIAVILGCMLSGYVVARYVAHITRKGGRIGYIICSVLIAPLSIQGGILLGGLGGGYGELLMGDTGVYIGVPIAITLGIVLIECIGALFGAFLGSFVQSLWQKCS